MTDVCDTASIRVEIKRLIREKTKRDKINFTSSQLANELNVPRSVIQRLIHDDPNKRVLNPKIDTLLKIVQFFRSDGFDVTIEDLLGVRKNTAHISRASTDQTIAVKANIPLFSSVNVKYRIGSTEVDLEQHQCNTIAVFVAEDIKPTFNTGSIFIVDLDMPLEHDSLIATHQVNTTHLHVFKYYESKREKLLIPIDNTLTTKINYDNCDYLIIGTIVQIHLMQS